MIVLVINCFLALEVPQVKVGIAADAQVKNRNLPAPMDSDWLKETQAEMPLKWTQDRKQGKKVSWILDVMMWRWLKITAPILDEHREESPFPLRRCENRTSSKLYNKNYNRKRERYYQGLCLLSHFSRQFVSACLS